MKLHLYHGRTTPNNPTDIDGKIVDDWGFEGPLLENVKALSWTYGVPYVHFTSKAAHSAAKELTSWLDGHFENSLIMAFEDDCVRTFSHARGRKEYFGDWSLAEGEQL